MVENRVTDGERIATLLRAEIDGRETAGLDRLSILEGADRAELSVDEDSAVVDDDGRVLATLEPTSDGLFLHVRASESAVQGHADDEFLKVEEADDQFLVTVPTAAAVKRAVDLLAAASEN
ncbi:hypothetical protein HLRTI_002472 [Halorhabdus tiamatea SARL4B]|uniref:DUF7993 domain-containing protein n=1 Tax=Halorhabdus tiamatea SARL4B TaxID=1033806 RepID=F7PMA1_9EURY|nr:hypothetical protein [Halorhabdus tiamatea]ERJ05494.1 hypothetical protein HLRTI_002472 [Halorhabdus tiamatea SARL4B]CCQ32915.1 conserved hypothetical protein [Halorhabdus tiamatea SARL4B]